MLTIALLGQFIFLVGALLLSARRTIRTRGFLGGIIQGALLLYGLAIVESFVFSVVIPSLLILIGADRHVVLDSFPEAICNVPVVLVGWTLAAVFAVLVRSIYDISKIVLGGKEGICEMTKSIRGKKLSRPPTFW